MHGASFVADLAVVLSVAAVTGVVSRFLSLPTVLGYLAAGLIVGPHVPIPLFADAHRIEAMSEFGVVLVMFSIGLELRVRKFAALLPKAGLVLLLELGTMTWAGFSVGALLGWSTVASLFLGTAIAISSTMIVTKVFEDRPVAPDVRSLVLGILVLQDVAAVVLIAAMTGVAAGKGLSPDALAATLGRLGLVLVGMLGLGMLVVPRAVRLALRRESAEVMTVVAAGIGFLFAEVARGFGYSVALGAFLAGVLVAESGRAPKLEHAIKPVRDLFAAIFFVAVGMAVDPRLALAHLHVALLVAAVVVVGFFLSVTIGALLSGSDLRRAITSGLALGQVGEFGFILAGIGGASGAAPPELVPIVVTASIVTAFTTPLALRGADRVVRLTERALPHRIQYLIHLHGRWLDTAKARMTTERTGTPLARAVRVLLLDATLVVAILALSASWLPRLVRAGVEATGTSLGLLRTAAALGVSLALLPLLASLFRATRALARIVGDAAVAPGSGAAALARGALRGLVLIAVTLGLGIPAAAFLRPFAGGPFVLPIVVLIVAALAADLWRTAGRVQDEMRSGAERLVGLLAMPAVAGERPTLPPVPPPFPGLDQVASVALDPTAHAVGRTLTELDLRALTGATVLAIHRAGRDVTVPSGRERLLAGDVLALAGASEAIPRAEALLLRGEPPPDAAPEPEPA